MLETANRTDVVVAVGRKFPDEQRFMEGWVKDYRLEKYPGKVRYDGVNAMVEEIMARPDKTTLLCISAMPNLADAVEMAPEIAGKIRFVGMHGSIYRGYDGKFGPDAESNVKYHNESLRRVFSMLKDITIAPLDTCGIVKLEGELYSRIKYSEKPLNKAVMENYRLWRENVKWHTDCDPEKESSVLFDTVAAYLVYSEELVEMKRLSVKITPDGMTVPDINGISLRAALKWKNLGRFRETLVKRLLA